MEQVEDESQALVPIEQQTIMFYGKPLVVVRLPDGRPGVVLRYLCDNMQLDASGQIKRIRRTAAIADSLVFTRIETEGGLQRMHTLVLRGVPYWLLGIDPNRARPEMREEILRYQREAADVLYAWASTPRAVVASTNLVPAEPVTKPIRPSEDAPLAEWRDYHLHMAALIEWQMDVEQWRSSIEGRLEGLEAITDLIPEILERLPPLTLTSAHQKLLQYYVKQLHEATGKPYPTVYEDLKMAFVVPRYQEILEEDWERVVRWFKVQIEHKRERKK